MVRYWFVAHYEGGFDWYDSCLAEWVEECFFFFPVCKLKQSLCECSFDACWSEEYAVVSFSEVDSCKVDSEVVLFCCAVCCECDVWAC